MKPSHSTKLPGGGAIQTYSIGELAKLYKVSYKTFSRWMKRHQNTIGERVGWYYNIKQVQTIFELFGLPDSLDMAA